MSRLRRAAAVGAVLSVAYVTWDGGPPPLSAMLDVVVWLAYAVVASVGSFIGISIVLAWQHARSSPRWLLGTLAGLILLSMPPVLSFARETREARRFVATADSIHGVVANKYVRGAIHVIVDYKVGGQTYRIHKTGENPYYGTPAFAAWKRGDSIRVYYQPAMPQFPVVGFPEPERKILMESLAKLWIVWSVLLTAHLRLIVRGSRRMFAVIKADWQRLRTQRVPQRTHNEPSSRN